MDGIIARQKKWLNTNQAVTKPKDDQWQELTG